jgi:hypothetical protein
LISAQELNSHGYPTTDEQAANLAILLDRINRVRAVWGHPMTVTSGLRSEADQARINPSAPKSKHLMGQACDIYDPDGSLKTWVMANMPLMETIGFWFEDFSSTPNWVHFQIVPPGSGKRVFHP